MNATAIMLGKAGFVMFTTGLLIGAIVSKFRNPRMGLSAHLTAVQTGPALIAFALFWSYLGVPADWAPLIATSLAGSSALLVTGLTLAAITGASRVLPIAGHGFSASKANEAGVAIIVLGSSVWMLITCLAICGFAVSHS
jgi:(hydroxyamino)benzene mutase